MAKTNAEFISKIKLLLKDETLKNKISKNARKLAEEKSLKNNGKQLKIAYLKLLSR